MKLGGLLKSLAPTIASAAGGPMAGMAVKMAASKLGIPDATAKSTNLSTLSNGVAETITSYLFHALG